MEKFSIENIKNIKVLRDELEYEKAASMYLQLRVLEKKDASYREIRCHLKDLIKVYEQGNWADEPSIADKQLVESDQAEAWIRAENEFHARRKEIIKQSLKEAGLNQNQLALLLGHGKSYMSELINGLRPFSKEDIVVLNRLFKIPFEELIPTFIRQERAAHIRRTLDSLENEKVKF